MTGDAGPEHWDAEYRRTGRVVFPRRRRSLFTRQVLLSWVVVIVAAIGITDEFDTRGTWFYIRACIVALLVSGAVSTTAQILRGTPVLTVDTTGIRLGDDSTPWTAITTIGAPVTSFFSNHLPIHFTNEDGDDDDLEIPRDNVDDLPSLAAWLNHLHTERRIP
ncbi:hypothetical protein ACFTSF_17145 [Kribbella sp. NPDC056951]|uniref:hypothetical protein n=1 Tax=Kribbella sp. NPDC056951 TaxID=3345978 RepID=UPI003636296A